MKENEIRRVYETIEMNPDTDKKIQRSVIQKMEQNSIQKRRKIPRIAAAVLTVIIVAAGMLQIPEVSAKAGQLLENFTNVLRFEGKSIEMEGTYVHVKGDSDTEMQKCNTIEEIEEKLGIKILESEDAFKDADNLFSYNPYVKDGQLYGAMIKNDFYLTGDLQDIQVETKESISVGNSIHYSDGEEYKSPLFTQITVRTDNKESADYDNYELEYAGNNWELPKDAETEVYQCENLGINVVLYTVVTDGIESWNDGNITKITIMQFVYDGVEYIYGGDVSYDTMKKIAEGLKY